jgi:alcohol dehydrogenase
VGLSAIMIGVALGARVIAVDVAPAALDRARALGAVVVASSDVPAAVHEITGGGAHVSVDAIGSTVTAVNSVRSLRRRGRHVQVGLLFGPSATPPLPMDRVVAWELAIHGSHGMAAHEYPTLLALVADGTLRPDLLVGTTVGLAEAGTALATMDENRASGMTVVDMHAE